MNADIANNSINLVGQVISGFTFSHEIHGEGFYNIKLAIQRLSGEIDLLPVLVSDRLLDVSHDYSGQVIQVLGQYRSSNVCKGDKKGLYLYAFAREIYLLRPDLVDATKSNTITLKGFVCKTPVFRETPRGRIITDLLLAVNRSYGKSDYIPCVVWGRDAGYAADLLVSTAIEITGRIQSRQYQKRLEDGTVETRTAYEVSCSKINLIQE